MADLGSNTLNHTDNLLIQRNASTKINVTNTGVVVTGIVTATTFDGALTGTATNATNVTLAAGSLTTNYVTFAEGTTGNRPIKTDTGLTYNASTNLLGASISGNAATAATAVTATNCSRSIIAGNGMTGTGDGALTANRTITLGTPGSVTNTSTNDVSPTSHTHEIIDSALVVSAAGAVGAYQNARTPSVSVAVNGTTAGSNLQTSGGEQYGNPAFGGTWRCMGGPNSGGVNAGFIGLWQRIS